MPGHFENPKPFTEISLSSYTDHVAHLLKKEDTPPILVGHSMAGCVITQLGELMPDNIRHLVYISGFIPENGGCLVDEEKKSTHPSIVKEIEIDLEAKQISFKHKERLKNLFYHRCAQEWQEFAMGHLQDQPLQPFLDKVWYGQTYHLLSKTYIECLDDLAIHITDQRRMHNRINCTVKSLKSDHSPFFSHQEELIDILVSI